jgi:hypothetical protein
MKNRREQLKSLNTALQNIRKDKDEDRKKRKEINPTYDGRHHHGTFKKVEDVQEDLPANAVGQGGVDMNPTGGPARLKKSPMRRFEPAFDKRHKNKKLLLTKFRQHAYGD